MVRISMAVAAHPKRQHLVGRMLEGPLWGINPEVVWDTKDNIWDTHQRAWETYDKHGTHHLVLQDDAIPCQNLIPGLEMALPSIPAAPVNLYFGNARSHPKIVRTARRAEELKASWIVSTGCWWGVAILLPVQMVEPMLTFCMGRRETYDRRLSIWAEHFQYPVFYPWPSLVDHVDEESLVNPGRRPGRKAYKFIGEDVSALSWNPNGEHVGMGRGVREALARHQ